MRKKLLFTASVLLLSLGLDASWTLGEAGQPCTIACEYAPEVKCHSQRGNCQYYYGAYDYIICDGESTRCPL
jgi:hypothetical protein